MINKKLYFTGKVFLLMVTIGAITVTGCGRKDSAAVYQDRESSVETKELSEISETDSEIASETVLEDKSTENEGESISDNEVYYVYVCGAVNSPGVYKLPKNSRVFQAVDAAGGANSLADVTVLNMAGIICDGVRIYIPTYEETKSGNYEFENSQTYADVYSEINSGIDDGGTKSANESKLININTADADELMQLPGIGQSRADAIIAYRENNGQFESISDIMKVNGIKEAAFEKIKDLIKI